MGIFTTSTGERRISSINSVSQSSGVPTHSPSHAMRRQWVKLLHVRFSRHPGPLKGQLGVPLTGPNKCTAWYVLCGFLGFFFTHKYPPYRPYMDVSENSGTPKSSHSNSVFHYKPSILGYPYFWKHPYRPYIGISYRGTLVRGMTLAQQKKAANENPIGGSTGDQTASKMGHEAAAFGDGGMEFLVCVEKLTFNLRSK